MNKKTDKKLKGIFVGIGLPVISGTILMLIDPIRIFLFSFSKSIWIWLLAKFESFTVYLGTNHEINGAVLIVLLIIVFVFMILVLLIIRESIESKTYTKYTEDEFFNVIWRWTWSRHKIINLWCFCKSCDLELSYDDSSTRVVYN